MPEQHAARDEDEVHPDLAAGEVVEADVDLDPATFVDEDPDGDTGADEPATDDPEEPDGEDGDDEEVDQ